MGSGVGIAVVPVDSCADVFKVTRAALVEGVRARVTVGVGVRRPATTYPACPVYCGCGAALCGGGSGR
jgi:hypothetical protein